MRPLTKRQETALVLGAYWGISQSTEGSMPSLAGRGFAERYRHTEHGRSYVDWRITDAGRAEAARIRTRDAAAKP